MRNQFQTALPAWQQATRDLDAVVADYNAKCLGPIYTMDVKQAQTNLVCPAVP